MKRIIIAALATSALAYFLIQRRNKKIDGSTVEPLSKRIGNREKHLTSVFSKAKQQLINEADIEDS